MAELLTLLIVLACPLAMGAMMALPVLGRLFRRRAESAPVGGEVTT